MVKHSFLVGIFVNNIIYYLSCLWSKSGTIAVLRTLIGSVTLKKLGQKLLTFRIYNNIIIVCFVVIGVGPANIFLCRLVEPTQSTMRISSVIGKLVSVYNDIKILIFTIILIIHIGTDLLNFLIPKAKNMLLSDAFQCYLKHKTSKK